MFPNLGIRRKFALFCIMLGTPFFFIGGPGYHASRVFQSVWNLGHIFFFALVSWLLSLFFLSKESDKQFAKIFFQVFFVVLVFGILIEIVQMGVTGRSPDLFDLLRNQTGCLLACAFFCPGKIFCVSGRKFFFQFFVSTMLMIALWPLVQDVSDELIAWHQFPVLSDFETPFEKSRWVDSRQLSIERKIVRKGKKSMKVKLSTAKYSGTSLFFFPSDWQGYKTLHLSVYNPLSEDLFLHCRIHDKMHKQNGQMFNDRFHSRFALHSGWNELVISLDKVRSAPLGREMEMDKIERLGFFVIRQSSAKIIYIDNVYLSK